MYGRGTREVGGRSSLLEGWFWFEFVGGRERMGEGWGLGWRSGGRLLCVSWMVKVKWEQGSIYRHNPESLAKYPARRPMYITQATANQLSSTDKDKSRNAPEPSVRPLGVLYHSP
ncbi:hypothetical protein PILCRDRAFT_505967 [Piloderma croceum F 1598]|uniref:Uncharacterized protein n=1 Tax=Piloderma croceum (strain F 1598) TaxID=765440 RepID=A0A0C3B4W5_PILCF|nr:hypothetical protein PILCRDRAFT_505967 [Piloderma croceum F 1598]